MVQTTGGLDRQVRIPIGDLALEGNLQIPGESMGVVIFAHGSGSSRHSPRNRFVAEALHQAGVGTLLMDLLSRSEEQEDLYSGHLRFNIDLLAQRLQAATDWIKSQSETGHLAVGYFGASTGGAAALVAAARSSVPIGAVVSRGGRPDLAEDHLALVTSPTLLMVGEIDYPVLDLNQRAYGMLNCEKHLEVIPDASHLFEEPGALEKVAEVAAEWFREHLRS